MSRPGNFFNEFWYWKYVMEKAWVSCVLSVNKVKALT